MGQNLGERAARVGGGALLAAMVIMFFYLFATGQFLAMIGLGVAGHYVEKVHKRYSDEKKLLPCVACSRIPTLAEKTGLDPVQ